MTLTAAPLFTDVSPAPLEGAAYWTHAADGVRIRLGVFQPDEAKGTVLLFPGRTEYVEKYAPAAGDLAQRGGGSPGRGRITIAVRVRPARGSATGGLWMARGAAA